MHTLLDPIIPYWHEPLYTLKTVSQGSTTQRINIPIQSYGHCNFNEAQTLVALVTLVFKAGSPAPTALDEVLSNGQMRQEFRSLSETLQH
jgi:hypothetical protein